MYFLVLGIFLGSYIAAKGSKNLDGDCQILRQYAYSAIGGIFMGFGASVAGGCSIGNGLVETATMSWQGWIALASMIIGVWFYEVILFLYNL